MYKSLPFFLVSFPLSIFADPLPLSEQVYEMAFVSCFKEHLKAPALTSIAEINPDVFLWMGDNVYGNTDDMKVLADKYQSVRELPAYAKIASHARVIGTWDDHDYGHNDNGKEYKFKDESQVEFLNFMDVPETSPRRKQEGVYHVTDFGPPESMVRVITLDTRYFRDPIGSEGTILGEAQWKWLEKILTNSPAKINILVSSIQVLPAEHRYEKWANFPNERERLFKLLAEPETPPVLLLTGDRHLSEISLDSESCGYPLYEITSSSLNLPLGGGYEPNKARVGEHFRPANFGTLSIDWSQDIPVLTACIRDSEGRPQRAITFQLKK